MINVKSKVIYNVRKINKKINLVQIIIYFFQYTQYVACQCMQYVPETQTNESRIFSGAFVEVSNGYGPNAHPLMLL